LAATKSAASCATSAVAPGLVAVAVSAEFGANEPRFDPSEARVDVAVEDEGRPATGAAFRARHAGLSPTATSAVVATAEPLRPVPATPYIR
jgi:hypothetical protein